MKQKRIIILLCMTFFMSGCSKQALKENPNPHQEIGSEVAELHIGTKAVTSVSYPKTGYEKLDTKIAQKIRKLKSDFKKDTENYRGESAPELNINFESYMKDKRYLSVRLLIYEHIYNNKEISQTLHYDIEKDDFFDLEDLFEDDFLPYVSKQARQYFQSQYPEECKRADFRIGISPVTQNYQEFVLQKDKLVFYFNPGTLFDQGVSFSMSFDKLAPYTDLEKEEKTVFVPYDDVLNEPVRVIDPKQPMVALTFDDGPTRKYTEAILDALKEHNSAATFFVLGNRASNAPDLLQRMIMEGSEIGNHTYSHKQLTTLSKERIEEEITHTQETIHKITNQYPSVIRPPYGSRNDNVLSCARNKRIVTWTLDTEDWKSRNTKTIVNRVMNTVKDKDIILMHDLYATSAEAAIILIDELHEQGYQLVTVSQLYEYSDSHQYQGK